MFDTFDSYAVLPISVTTLLTSKICSFSVLQIIPTVFIAIIAIASGQAAYLIPALVLCLGVSFYSLGVTVWLTGLSPSVLVYRCKSPPELPLPCRHRDHSRHCPVVHQPVLCRRGGPARHPGVGTHQAGVQKMGGQRTAGILAAQTINTGNMYKVRR